MAIVRSIKNYAKGFSDVQIKVREATSNDSWGPSGSLMNEIAQLTFNEQDFIEIMDMLDRRLNDKGKNWRHVFKALLVLDYCLHVGSENVVLYAKENIYVVRTLKEFQHIDDSGKDVGFNVRQKAKDITSLLLDDNRLKEERKSRNRMADRMAGVGDYMNDVLMGGPSGSNSDGQGVYRQPGYVDEDKDLKRAIEESKRMAEQEFRNRGEGTDADLQKAIEESEREARESERKKREALERENQNNLFRNQQVFQPFPANQSFDASLNPYGQQPQLQQPQLQQQAQWPQATGFTGMSFAEPIQQQQQQNNPYATGGGFNNFNLQAQMTGVPSLQSQMTGFVPQQQQQAQHYFPTQQQHQQQPQFTGMNPFGQQQQPFGQNATGTSSVQQGGGGGGGGMFGTQNSQTGMQATTSLATTENNSENPHYSKLNSMLANRDDGMDTFGNTGNLRIPYGTGFASTLVPQKKDVLSITDSPSTSSTSFSQPFAQQPNRNPFGQPSTPTSGNTTNGGQQKSLLEMMQEQKLQQQQYLQAQMTGYPSSTQTTGQQQQGYMFNNNPSQQPIQPQPTAAYTMMNQQSSPFSNNQQQQHPFNFNQQQQQQPSFF